MVVSLRGGPRFSTLASETLATTPRVQMSTGCSGRSSIVNTTGELEPPKPLRGRSELSISPARILSFIVLLTASLGGASVLAGGQSLISTNSDHVAIQGYDPVAYFTDGKAMMGSADHSYQFDGATWHFASDVHRALF